MDNALYYLTLNRQVGLAAELDLIANNVANLDTTGFRREGVAFTEFVLSDLTGESVSMADLGSTYASPLPGAFTTTGGQFDLAIDGDGFFALGTERGPILTRAGAFQVSQEGIVVTPNGDPLLDTGQAEIAIPPGATGVLIAQDGTISAGGEPIAQVGLFTAPSELMARFGDTAFTVVDDAFEPIAFPKVKQGALEQSNVDATSEIARMIEVTRAYEMAQSIITDEDDRVTNVIRTLGQVV